MPNLEVRSYPVVLRLGLRVEPRQKEALLDFLREATPFYESADGVRIRLLQSAEDPCTFIEEVRYRSADLYEADNIRVDTDTTMKQLLERWRALLAKPAEVSVFHDLTSELRVENG